MGVGVGGGGGGFRKSGRQRLHDSRISLWRLERVEFILPHSITPRVITVSPLPPPHLRSLNADCMHGSLSHLDNPGSVQLGPFGWIQSLERCYTWPNRGSPAFTGAGVTQSVHLLHYGLDEAGFQSSQGQETFLSCKSSTPTLGPTQPRTRCVPEVLFRG